jgi:RNA polymerase sigma-70 factor, ECF subfamily
MVTPAVNEVELVSAARSGDSEALGALMASCYQPTFRLAIRILRNREDAEDALQDAMLKAYCNLNRFQGNARFRTWVARIAINEALMRIRRRRSQKEMLLDHVSVTEGRGFHGELQDWSNYPEKTYAQQELRDILEEALKKLSPRLGAAFRLRNVEELSVKETGARLDLTTHGVKSRVSRARSRLRRRLKKILRGSVLTCTQRGEAT